MTQLTYRRSAPTLLAIGGAQADASLGSQRSSLVAAAHKPNHGRQVGASGLVPVPNPQLG